MPLVLGGGTTLYSADSAPNYASSSESGVQLRVRGKMHTLGSPAGERVFRRIYVTVVHTQGVSLYVTPIVDGVRYTELRTYLSRPAPANNAEERFVFRVALTKTHTNYPNIVTGIRGTSIEVDIDLTAPSSTWYLETVTFAMNPRNEGRGKRAE